MKICILALDGVFDTGLATVLDAFTTANELAEMSGITSLHFDITIVGVQSVVRTSQGLSVPVIRPDECPVADWVIVPAIGFKMPGPLQAALARPDMTSATECLRRWAEQGTGIAAACIGTFVLAESSLLDHQEATTTWWLAPLFRKRYPKVRLDESRMIINSSQFLTSGAALSHLDLALWLIRHASPELAAMTAKYLTVDTRLSQTVYMIPTHLAQSDPLVELFERWARGRLSEGFSLEAAARATATSKRTLARRIQQVLGKSPLSYFQDLRVERAIHLLQTSDMNVEQIASMVGYTDGVTLRALLRRRLGRGVRELRTHQ